MKNLARGSVCLGVLVLIVSLFYIQPTVEAVTLASDSQNNLQLNIQETNFNQEQLTQEITEQEPIKITLTQQDNPQDEPKPADDDSDKDDKKTMTISSYNATAYCLKGRTANGGSVRRGIVAADTRILPLGTQIQLDAGSYSGTYTVADTGGAVKGRRLDIWVPSCSEAVRFGRKKVSVSVKRKR